MKIDLTKFKDIYEVETITIDFSLYFIIITICIIIFSSILYIKTRKKPILLTKREITFNKLKTIDFNSGDTKNIIYEFTIYGKLSLDEIDKEDFEKIVLKLEPYKYIKEDKVLDKELINSMRNYIKKVEKWQH